MTDTDYSIEVPAPDVYQKDFDWMVFLGDKKVAWGKSRTQDQAFEKAHEAKLKHQQGS